MATSPSLIRVTPDKEKAKSMLRMSQITLARIHETDPEKYSTNILRDYYEILRELITCIALLDGFKAVGEGAHRTLIHFMRRYIPPLAEHDIQFMNSLRDIRNEIAYDGLCIATDILEERRERIEQLIAILSGLAEERGREKS